MNIVDVAFTTVAAVALAGLTLLVVADVSLRYGAGTPVFFAHDVVVLYLTPAVFFFGFGPTFWRDEHLAVDVITVNLPPRVRAVSGFLSAAIGLFVFGLLVWVSWERAWTSFLNDEVIASIVPWPSWASYVLVPVGSAAMVLACLAKAALLANTIVTGESLPAPDYRNHEEVKA